MRGEQIIIHLFKKYMIQIGVSLDCDAYDRVPHVRPDEGWLAGVVEEGEGVVHGAAQRLHFAALNRALQNRNIVQNYISCLNERQTHVLDRAQISHVVRVCRDGPEEVDQEAAGEFLVVLFVL